MHDETRFLLPTGTSERTTIKADRSLTNALTAAHHTAVAFKRNQRERTSVPLQRATEGSAIPRKVMEMRQGSIAL